MNRMCTHNGEQGVALIELAMVIPLMILIALGTTETIFWCRMNINTSVLSRDLGRAAFECAPGGNAANVSNCLEGRLDRLFDGGIAGPMSAASYVVTVWDFQGAGVPAQQMGRESKNGMLSRYDGQRVSELVSYSPAHQRIVIAEVEVNRRSRLISFDGNYYSVAVF